MCAGAKGETALIWASRTQNSLKCVELLLDRSASVNKTSFKRVSPLISASNRGKNVFFSQKKKKKRQKKKRKKIGKGKKTPSSLSFFYQLQPYLFIEKKNKVSHPTFACSYPEGRKSIMRRLRETLLFRCVSGRITRSVPFH